MIQLLMNKPSNWVVDAPLDLVEVVILRFLPLILLLSKVKNVSFHIDQLLHTIHILLPIILSLLPNMIELSSFNIIAIFLIIGWERHIC